MLKNKVLCNMLLEKNIVKPYDIIKHSYSNDRMSTIEDVRIENKNDNRVCCALTTRPDTLGVVVYV